MAATGSKTTSLTSLLAQCENLHGDEALFSLQQLSTFHQTLLCSLLPSTTTSREISSIEISGGGGSSSPLDSAINLCCDLSEDQDLCHQILSPSQQDFTDRERLLVVQFLEFHLRPTDYIKYVLMPILFNGDISEELDMVLLECSKCFKEEKVEETPQWTNIVESLKSHSNPSASRLLARLLVGSPLEIFLIEAFYEKMWQLLQASVLTSSADFQQKDPFIDCLSRDLLPVLIKTCPDDGKTPTLWTENYKRETLALWTRIFSLQQIYPDRQREVLLTMTSVLCPLLPHFIEMANDVVVADDADDVKEGTLIKPMVQPELWKIIYSCLSQGKSIFDRDLARCSILRKRAVYLLDKLASSSSEIWKKYIMCFEVLEMEYEVHLVDQIWDTVAELFEDAVQEGDFDVLTLDWMSLLLSRALSAEQLVIRKLSIYRLLKMEGSKTTSKKKQKKQGKKKTRNIEPRRKETSGKPILARMSPEFLLYIFVPSWNSLAKSVGYNMHVEDNRKVQKNDMIPLFDGFLTSFVAHLDEKEAEDFWKTFWEWPVHQQLQARTIVHMFQCLERMLSSSETVLYADNVALESLIDLFQKLLKNPSIAWSYKKDLVKAMATMLENCQQPRSSTKKWTPVTILNILSLFSEDFFELDDEEWNVESDVLIRSLKRWTLALDQDSAMVGAAVSAAFVSGQLGPSEEAWDLSIGSSNLENDLGWAIPLLCTLAASHSNKTTTGELLWPSINKGLSNSASAILAKDIVKSRVVGRAILLLESGCKLRQLSGLGNGDLVVDKETHQLMPPPPNIEKMLSSAVDFLLHHIRTLLSMKTDDECSDSMTGSTLAIGTAKAFGRLITQLRTLQRAFPSSDRLSDAVSELLSSSCKKLRDGAGDDNHRMMLSSLIFAGVSCGADPGRDEYVRVSRLLLETNLAGDVKCSRSWEQTSRTVLMYSKWGAMSCILPMLAKSLKETNSVEEKKSAELLLQDLLTMSLEAVGVTSISALPALFHCILETGKQLSANKEKYQDDDEFAANFLSIIDALLKVMGDSSGSIVRSEMLNEICRFAFQPILLTREYHRLQLNPKSPDPIRRSFRRLIKMAGVLRHHISRAVLCRITVAWLGDDESNKSSLGLNAIPYRDDIVQLLLHKEKKLDESSLSQGRDWKSEGIIEIPGTTNMVNISRAFVLVFLSRLPDKDKGLNDEVLKELLHYVILRLIEATAPTRETNHVLIMKGTPEYVKKIRGWQALCILSRFVTKDIAEEVCRKTFKALSEPVHSQIRYFIEIFTIKCGTIHPEIFGPAFKDAIQDTDLTLPHLSSLMLIGGNWIVGRHKLSFFSPKPDSSYDLHLRQVLAAVIPWLSSTQGFSRAIAQLLVYALIPMVIDVSDNAVNNIAVSDSDWPILVIYKFLDENREMKRLRSKQSKFFDRYNVDEMCTVEDIFSIPLDEGEEAAPEHLIDIMKVALKNVYEESHASDGPEWKQVEKLLQSQQSKEVEGPMTGSEDVQKEVNFQRKIIPLDALNLAMEDLREKRSRNIAGNRKQQLVVCASLVDKVPNLAGLARTAEIFAADRLIIPDIGVTKMDNFKTISVGAGDWIDIEEVKERDLLEWLLDHKKKGYFVFGLEQTSSSMSITEMEFPDCPTILLLGKEKEGIPVEYLQVVDQCVEIPQAGIIRSLNVHVSGAIAIWEHTKQRRLPKGK